MVEYLRLIREMDFSSAFLDVWESTVFWRVVALLLVLGLILFRLFNRR